MADVALIPRRVLFGDAVCATPSLSPSGTHLAYIAPHENEPRVWFGRLAVRDFRPLTDEQGGPVNDYAWARDGRHLLYLCDRDGDERHHLIAVDLIGGGARDLTPYAGVRVRLVGQQPRAPGQVLVEMNRLAPDRPDLYRLDLADGTDELVATDEHLGGWLADPQLRVRGAIRGEADGGFTVMARDDEAGPWRALLTLGYEDATATQVLGFTGDGHDLLLLSPFGGETVRLLRLSVSAGRIDVLYEDPEHDVSNVSLHPIAGQVDLVVIERERTELVALTEETASDLRQVRSAGRGDVVPLCRDWENRRWLVQDNIDDGPAAYRLVDLRAGTSEVLFTHRPALAGHLLSPMEPFSFTARDGLMIHGYLTFPLGRRRNLPAVLNVHGGPWERNRWGCRSESQWLANRGYLCVEVNYRGSTGYGRGFELAGDHEWGGRMQDDLIDAIRWVIDEGHADPDRIAISGTSYGGYAALVGAAFTPEIFRCAVAVAAPVNLITFIESVPEYWAPVKAKLRRRIGDPASDAEYLWSRSPLSRAAQIRRPILLAYGRNDPRVPVAEAEQMVQALRAHGIEHEYVLFEDEGHGFRKIANALRFRAAAEEFLARHLGGRCEPSTPTP